MAGSIRQRGKQSWEVRAFAGKDPVTGKKRYVTRTIRGEHRDSQVALGRLLGEIDEGQHTVQVGTVAELCERWYSNAAPDLSPAVAAEYPANTTSTPSPSASTDGLDEHSTGCHHQRNSPRCCADPLIPRAL